MALSAPAARYLQNCHLLLILRSVRVSGMGGHAASEIEIEIEREREREREGGKRRGRSRDRSVRVSGMAGHADRDRDRVKGRGRQRQSDREGGRGRSGDLIAIAADPRFHEWEMGDSQRKAWGLSEFEGEGGTFSQWKMIVQMCQWFWKCDYKFPYIQSTNSISMHTTQTHGYVPISATSTTVRPLPYANIFIHVSSLSHPLHVLSNIMFFI
ncbi:hypothetical protein ACFX15_029707 [Malus domestica]